MGIETRGITKKYKDTLAVDSLDLEIKTGELFALLGVNGAGKTTAIKILSGLTKADRGEGFICGKSIKNELSQVKKLIAVSPQETAVAPNLTVLENLQLICGINGFSKEKTREKTDEMLEKLGLTEISQKRASKLSGGYKRRLSIAMSLISEPQVLFLDEPTLGLDVLARAELWELIRSLSGKMTIVLTTHYMEEAEALSDRIGIMQKGRLVAVGTAAELKERTGTDRFEDAFIKIAKGVQL